MAGHAGTFSAFVSRRRLPCVSLGPNGPLLTRTPLVGSWATVTHCDLVVTSNVCRHPPSKRDPSHRFGGLGMSPIVWFRGDTLQPTEVLQCTSRTMCVTPQTHILPLSAHGPDHVFPFSPWPPGNQDTHFPAEAGRSLNVWASRSLDPRSLVNSVISAVFALSRLTPVGRHLSNI